MGVKGLSYCGIDCRNFCIMGSRKLVKQARELEKSVREMKVEEWHHQIKIPPKEQFEFEEFIKGVRWLQKYGHCPGCRAGGGPPTCRARACAQSRNLKGCWECRERKTCEKLSFIEEIYPIVRENLEKIRGSL